MCLGGRAFVGCRGAAVTGVCGSAVAFVCAIGAQWLGMCLIGSAIVGGSFCAAAIGMCDVRTAFVARVCAPSRGGCANSVGFIRGVGAASLAVGLIGCDLVRWSVSRRQRTRRMPRGGLACAEVQLLPSTTGSAQPGSACILSRELSEVPTSAAHAARRPSVGASFRMLSSATAAVYLAAAPHM